MSSIAISSKRHAEDRHEHLRRDHLDRSWRHEKSLNPRIGRDDLQTGVDGSEGGWHKNKLMRVAVAMVVSGVRPQH
jgi:hypothetical protein